MQKNDETLQGFLTILGRPIIQMQGTVHVTKKGAKEAFFICEELVSVSYALVQLSLIQFIKRMEGESKCTA